MECLYECSMNVIEREKSAIVISQKFEKITNELNQLGDKPIRCNIDVLRQTKFQLGNVIHYNMK